MTRLCTVPGCDHHHVAKGLCGMHRQRMARYGSLEMLGVDHRGKLDADKVRAIRALVPSVAKKVLARRFGVDPSLIRQIALGKIWRHVE